MIEYNKELIEKIMEVVFERTSPCPILGGKGNMGIPNNSLKEILDSFLEPDLSEYPCFVCGGSYKNVGGGVVECQSCGQSSYFESLMAMACYQPDWRKHD